MRAFEHERVAALARALNVRRHIGDHRREISGECKRLIAHRLVGDRRALVVMHERKVVILEQHLQLFAEPLVIEQILNAQRAACDFVFVRGADAATGRSDFCFAHAGFARAIERRVHRQHERAGRRYPQTRTDFDTG